MDQRQPTSPRYRYRLSTLLFVIIIAALLLQLYLQTTRLQQSRVLAEQARAESAVARAALQKGLAEAQALRANQPVAPLPPTNSAAAPK
jgi:hypothetical protein